MVLAWKEGDRCVLSDRDRRIGTCRRCAWGACSSGAVLGAMLAASGPAQAQTMWTGATSTDWFTGSNWSAGVPSPLSDTVLDTVTPSSTVVNASAATARSLSVGSAGVGSLLITGGGSVTNGTGVIGESLGSRGSVTVTGAGSRWTNTSFLSVGEGGVGNLAIEHGGVVTNTTGYVGFSSGSEGMVTVTGPGSRWASSAQLVVGGAGHGQLMISNGGSVSNVEGAIGLSAGSQGIVTVTGAGSVWTSNAAALVVGVGGSGQLTVANGGTVNSAASWLGLSAGAQGTVTVSGAGSTWNSGDNLLIGVAGTGQLRIENGGSVSNGVGVIGFVAGSQGTVTVTGSGANLTNSGTLVVGLAGNGQLTIENGGAVSNTTGAVGAEAGSQGTVTVTGAGASWANSGTLVIGQSGTGQLTIAQGATVTAGGTVGIAELAGSTGILSIGAAQGQAAAAAGRLNAASIIFGAGTGTLNFNHTETAYEFAAAISGNGAVNVLSGTTILTAASSYTGPTSVSGGALIVNGSIASSVTLTGGLLGGTGTVGGITALAGSTVSPGNSIGTLTVTGNVAFAAGSTYRVEVNATGAGDRIEASGNATLTGGAVELIAGNGTYRPVTRYVILTASGGVSGQFAGLTSNLTFLTPTLAYEPTAVVLELARNNVTFASVAYTRNQFATATGVESLGYGNPVYDAVLLQTAPGARAAFDQLSGEIHASARTVAVETSHLIRETALGRLRALGGSAFPAGSTAVPAAFSADLAGQTPPVAMVPVPRFAPASFTLWAHGLGNWGRVDANGNAAKLDYSTGGVLFGAEATREERWRFGIAGGYTHSNLDVKDRLSTGDLQSLHAVLYGGASLGALQLRAGLAYAHNSYDIKRQIAFAAFTDQTKASYDGSTLQAFGELGYRFGFGAAMLEPFVGAAAIRVSNDRFVELGGAAALAGAARSLELGTTTLGLRGELALGSSSPLVLRGLLGWRYAFGDVTPTALLAFRAGGTGFAVAGVPVDRSSLVAEAGVEWRITSRASLSLGYSGAIGSRAQDHGVRGTIAVSF